MESGTEIFSKGTLVEVSSDEDGFKGAWYVATILESPPKSASKKRARALVEYQNLLADEEVGSLPLREFVETSFLRPLPPPDSCPEFCVGDVVDAFYRDGWWTGVIARFSEDSKCTVYFQNPPDEIEFLLSDLRAHRDWVDGNWIRPENKKTTGLIFSPGAAVEVILNEQGTRDVWFPAIVRREIGLGSFVVHCQSLKNCGEAVLDVTVDYLHIRPSPPCLEDRKYGLLDKVDAFYDYGWRNGVVTKVLTGERYVVFFKDSKTEKEFLRSDLRPHMEWVDGKWVGARQEVLGTTYSKQLVLVPVDSNNSCMGLQLENSCAVIDDAGDKTSHSTSSEKDQLRQPPLYLENSTSVGMTSDRNKMEMASVDDATPSQPSKKFKEGNVADDLISHAASQSEMLPICTPNQEVPCSLSTPTTGEMGSNLTEQCMAGNQSSSTRSAAQGERVVNEQKGSGLGNQTSNPVRRKGRPPKQFKITQPLLAGEEANMVHKAEGTVVKHTTNNTDMEMAVPYNPNDGTLTDNLSYHLNEESLKIMRDQKVQLDTTERLNIREIGKAEVDTVSTPLKRRGRPPKRLLEERYLEISSEAGVPRVLLKRSSKSFSAGRGPRLPVKRSPRTLARKTDLKPQRASVVGITIKGLNVSSEGSNLHHPIELEAGLDLNSADAPPSCKYDNEVGVGNYEMTIKACTMNEVEMCTNASAESTPRRGLQVENPGQHSSGEYGKQSTAAKPVGRLRNVEGYSTRTPQPRKHLYSDEVYWLPSRKPAKSSASRGRKRSINVNSVPSTQGSQDVLAEKRASLEETENKTKQVEVAVSRAHSDDQPLSMWFEGRHSPGVADNSRISPPQTVNQWNEARERPNEITQSPRTDATGEIMLDLNYGLPFVKRSPIWDSLETLEVFQRMPQNPHFRPLENCKEESREGLAIGNMVTFSNLAQKAARLRFDDPRSTFSNCLEALMELETHGFNIKPVQRRIAELLNIKDQQENLKTRTKALESQIMDHTNEKTKFDEELYEIDNKIIELQEKRAVALLNKESKDSEITALLSSVDAMKDSIQSARQEFERLATTRW